MEMAVSRILSKMIWKIYFTKCRLSKYEVQYSLYAASININDMVTRRYQGNPNTGLFRRGINGFNVESQTF